MRIINGGSMSFDEETKRRVFRRTDGKCYWQKHPNCPVNLVYENYGKPGLTGAWNIDHNWPKARGGTDKTVLHPSCYHCNSMKGKKRPGEFRGMEIPLDDLDYHWNKPPRWMKKR